MAVAFSKAGVYLASATNSFAARVTVADCALINGTTVFKARFSMGSGGGGVIRGRRGV